MKIRGFHSEDQESIAQIHAEMGLDYKMPDLNGKLMSAKAICEHDGRIVAAAALKLQPETYLWVSPEASPRQKWDAIRLIQKEMLKQALALGFEQVVAYVPDCVSRFSRRLLMLRWERPRTGWQTWVREVRL